MAKELYDVAYEHESRKFPAIIRMTKATRIILILLLIIYIAGSIGLAIFLGDGASAITTALFIAIAANTALLSLAFMSLSGNKSSILQAIVMVAIPVWAGLVFFIPALKSLANYLFIVPLMWLEIMIIVESIIHNQAQKRASDIAEMERDHLMRESAKSITNNATGDIIADDEKSATLKNRDARYCSICGIELDPDNRKNICPMCSSKGL